MIHNIIKIGNLGTQQIRKDFQHTEMDSFGMSICTVNRAGVKEKDNWRNKIDRSILSVRERDNCQGLPDPWLLVNKRLFPFTEYEEPTQAQLHEWLSHTEITRTAYQLVYFTQTASVSIEDVVAEVRKAYLNLKKSKLVGSYKPIVDNVFDICRWEDPTVMDNMLKDIGCPADPSIWLYPSHPNTHHSSRHCRTNNLNPSHYNRINTRHTHRHHKFKPGTRLISSEPTHLMATGPTSAMFADNTESKRYTHPI